MTTIDTIAFLELGRKDLEAAILRASQAGLSLPVLNAVDPTFKELAGQGDGEIDRSALLVWLERLDQQHQDFGLSGKERPL